MRQSNFFSSSLTVNGSVGGSSLLTGLKAYWNFDSSSSGHFADSVNSISTTTENGILYNQAGILGRSVEYDTSTDYIIVNNDTRFQVSTAEYTVSLWVNLNTLPLTAGRTYTLIRLFDNTYSLHAFSITLPNDANYIATSWHNTSTNEYYFENNQGLTTAAWHHICVVNQGSGLPVKIYQNAVNKVSFSSPSTNFIGTHVPGDNTLRIGNTTTATTAAPIGKIDEIGLWQRALTQLEVSTLYNNGVGVAYPFS